MENQGINLFHFDKIINKVSCEKGTLDLESIQEFSNKAKSCIGKII